MDKKIEAGVVEDAESFLKKLGDILTRGLDKLLDLGISVREDAERAEEVKKEAKRTENTNKRASNTTDTTDTETSEDTVEEATETKFFIIETVDPKTNETVEVKLAAHSLDESGTRFDLIFTLPGDKEVTKENIRADQLDSIVVKVLEDAGLGTFENAGEIKLSSNIRATLKKVVSADEISIQLVSIQAGSDPLQAFAVVKEITENPEFVATLTDEPKSFLIQDNGSDYDVDECDCIDTSATYMCMLQEALRTLSVTQAVHLNAKGEDFFTLHEKLDSYIESLREQVDAIAEMCVEFNGCVPSPIDVVAGIDSEIDGCAKFTATQGFQVVKTHLDKLVDTYSALYCNCPADVQSELDSWIREWKKEADYKLASTLS